MPLLILSFLAGILTVAAPCILPLLPVVIGGSLTDPEKSPQRWLRPVRIAGGLAGSVIIFSLLLKATTALLGVPTVVWQLVSGSIIMGFGVTMLLPHLWENLAMKLNLQSRSQKIASKHIGNGGALQDIALGAALGPVFSSCSPTYAFIVAAVIPVSFIEGFLYLVAYAAGLSSTLLLIAVGGQKVVQKLGWIANPNGALKKGVGILFLLVGLFILTGTDKRIQSYVLEQGWYDPISSLEDTLK